MSTPIGFREFNEDDYRRFVRTLSDEELIKAGKRLRILSGDGKIVTTTPCVFDEQLKICRKSGEEREARQASLLNGGADAEEYDLRYLLKEWPLET